MNEKDRLIKFLRREVQHKEDLVDVMFKLGAIGLACYLLTTIALLVVWLS